MTSSTAQVQKPVELTPAQKELRKKQSLALFQIIYNHEQEKGINKMIKRSTLQTALFEGSELTDKHQQFIVLKDLLTFLLKIDYIREWKNDANKSKTLYFYGVANEGRKKYEESLNPVDATERPF